jgi:hypothetical protein
MGGQQWVGHIERAVGPLRNPVQDHFRIDTSRNADRPLFRG